MDVDEEVDIILPVKGYDPVEAYAEIRSMHGVLFQQRSRFEQVINRQIDSISAIDSRFGGVDRRLDKLEERMGALEERLDRVLGILESRR